MIRSLTRLEQLQWYKQFLEDQIRLYQEELEICKEDMEKEKIKRLNTNN